MDRKEEMVQELLSEISRLKAEINKLRDMCKVIELDSFGVEINNVFAKAERLFGLSREVIVGNCKARKITYVRMSIAYILCDMGVSDNEVGVLLNKDRTSIIYYRNRVRESCKYNKELYQIYSMLFFG